ncbi:MAG TPA: acetyltransferase [Candidatus Acidoferrum sp.]|jgi:acetyltransferase EpsM
MGNKRVLVWGAGGHGKVVIDALMASGEWKVVAVLDEDEKKRGTEVLGVKVILLNGDVAEAARGSDCDRVAIAIGDNYVRLEKLRQARRAGLRAVNVVHPKAHISRFVKMGEGVTILAGATINPGTTIEDNVCVNTSASVDHDNYLSESCHIFPNATLTGGVRIGEFAYVGSGAVIAPNLTVGKYSCVGAGAVVLADVAEGKVVFGVPAKVRGEQTKRPGKENS